MAVRKRDSQTEASTEVVIESGDVAVVTKERAPRPKFQLKLVGEAMPAKNKRGGGKGRGKGTEYVDALNAVKELNDGNVYEIAQFFTKTGAQGIVRLIEKGEKDIPDGKWDIQSRTVDGPEVDGKQVQSVLLARYVSAE